MLRLWGDFGKLQVRMDPQQNLYKLQFQNRKARRRQMGASLEKPNEELKSPSDYFVCLVPSPESGKMMATVNVYSMMMLNQWSLQLEKLSQTKAESILIPKQYKIGQRSVCGENFRLEIEYDCFHIQLSEELAKRSRAEKYLEESEIWYLAYCLAESASACHRLGNPVGDLRPQNILLNASGKLKILSRWSAPTREDSLSDPVRRHSLYSPEELELIKRGYKQYQLDFVAAESFSIGMTLLSAGTIHNLEQCYDYTKSELNMIEFNRMLTFWHQNEFYSQLLHQSITYSRQLKSIVIRLLELYPDRRMTSLQLSDILEPHKTAIMAQQPFQLQMSRLNSPKKRSVPKDRKPYEVIHVLRSRKRSEVKESSHKNTVNNSKVEVSNFLQHLNMEFSFNDPVNGSNTNKKSVGESSSPPRKQKLNTSLHLSKQGETFK